MNIYSSSMASCLTDSGVLLAMIEEERLTRLKDKEDHGMSYAWCKNIAESLGFNTSTLNGAQQGEEPGKGAWGGDNHHLYHAASAYSQSGFRDASILVLDGSDEDDEYAIGIYSAKGGEIKEIRRYSAEYYLGKMFSFAARHCGFSANSTMPRACHAGKVMGLATYGGDYAGVPLSVAAVLVDRDTGNLLSSTNPVHTIQDTFKDWFGLEEAETFSFKYTPVAHYVQRVFEESVYSFLAYMQRNLPSNNLIIAGGCGLNSTLNGKIIRSNNWERFYVPPLCTDAGLMLGRAFLEENLVLNRTLAYNQMKQPFPAERKPKRIYDTRVADMLHSGEVVAWFAGGSEYGPRALGHRSLLARADIPWMANYLNELKGREPWRPLAPVVLDTYFERIFKVKHLHHLHRFMLATEYVHGGYCELYQSVVAPDGTSRPQLLMETEGNLPLYSLMRDMGLPILINTSLNGHNEPICETVDEACNFAHSRGVHVIFVHEGKLYELDTSPKESL